uniref:Arginine vasopressin-induced protein 1 n=1 Tax=Sphenodon punctatus TaxID=8508 RepID=A0A8D0H0M7_SPHPU
MGTPASVAACELPQCQAPESRSRKKASGNIFQGVGLLELWRLFRSSGDAWAEERARLVWECAGEQRVAQALGQLHRRQRRRPRQRRDQPQQRGPAMDPDSDIGQLGLQHFSSLRIEDRSSPLCGDAGGSSKLEVPGRARQRKGGPGPLGYLRGVRR